MNINAPATVCNALKGCIAGAMRRIIYMNIAIGRSKRLTRNDNLTGEMLDMAQEIGVMLITKGYMRYKYDPDTRWLDMSVNVGIEEKEEIDG